MARDYATIQTKIRDNPDWTNLTTGAQSLYIHCLTHSTLTIAGVLDWRPNRLATLAADLTTETVNTLGNELEAAGFLIIDHDAEYAFIRSFHRHDGTMKQRNLGTSAARLITNIDSPYIKDHIAHELWRIHADHPDWAGFKSEELREFMDRRANMTPDTTPPTTPHVTPGLTPPMTLNEGVNRGGANEGTDDPIHDPGIQGAGESLNPLNPETLKPKKISATDEPRPRDPHDPADRFDEFWDLVPVGRKVKRPKAVAAFRAAVKRAGDPQIVIDGMRRYADDPNLPDPRGPEAQYILHPTTWLNGDCWNDPPLPARGSAGNAGKSARGASPARSVAPGDLLGLMVGGGDGPTVIDGEIVDGEQGMIA